jgi:PleD family two-component response regulator
MNRCILTTTALAFSLALVSPFANACGEGQFNMGQGLRYQGYLAPHPATVLVYDGAANDRKTLYAGLQKAGHKVTVVGTAAAMSQALQAGRYDVVIADFDDAAALQSHAAGAAAQPRVLPVIARSRRNAPEVSSRFKLFLLDGASLGQYLKAINQSLALRMP